MTSFNSAPTTSTLRSWWYKTLMLILLVAGGFATGANAQTGNVCGTPIVVNALPFNHAGNTSSYGDDYEAGDVPTTASGAITNGTGSTSYITGDDVVYSYTASVDQRITISTTNDDDWIGLWAFTGCPFSSTVGYHTATSGTTRSIPNLELEAGTTYYFVVSTWATPQSTAYTINIILEWIAADPCTGTPVAGTLPAQIPSCLGSTRTLEPTGSVLELDLTYLWEQSSDSINWTSATGTNNLHSYTTPPFSVPTYYRMVVTCNNSTLTDTTTVGRTIELSAPPYLVFDGISHVQDFESWTSMCASQDIPSINWSNTPTTGLNSWRQDNQGSSAGWASSSGIYSPVSSSGARSARFHSVEAPNFSTGTMDLYVDMTAATGNTKL
ncbi:MAG: hypothetical protein WBG34_12445, partial [Flavobacteriales bacterium]